MAKVGHLEVQTLNIAEAAVSGRVSRTGPGNLAVPNVAAMPVELYVTATSSYSGSESSGSYTFTMTVTRLGGGGPSFTRSWSRSGNTSGSVVTQTFSGAMLDPSPGANPTYVLTLTASNNAPGSIAFGTVTGMLTAIYAKK